MKNLHQPLKPPVIEQLKKEEEVFYDKVESLSQEDANPLMSAPCASFGTDGGQAKESDMTEVQIHLSKD